MPATKFGVEHQHQIALHAAHILDVFLTPGDYASRGTPRLSISSRRGSIRGDIPFRCASGAA